MILGESAPGLVGQAVRTPVTVRVNNVINLDRIGVIAMSVMVRFVTIVGSPRFHIRRGAWLLEPYRMRRRTFKQL